jgi:hypothetical protein
VSAARLLAAMLAAVAVAALAAPAQGADRLARAAAALKRSPLFVHPDVLWMLPAGDRARIERELRASPVPVRAAVLPVIPEDESYGDSRRVLFGLHRRLGRPGVLVVVDEAGTFDVESFDVARRIDVPFDLITVDADRPPVIGARLRRLVDIVGRAPAGPAAVPKPRFVPRSAGDGHDEFTVWEVILLGTLLGGFAYAALRLVVGVVGQINRIGRAR